MSDYKELFSAAAEIFVEASLGGSERERRLYEESRRRAERYEENWAENAVNLIVICDEFAPGAEGFIAGVKYIFRGERFAVVADMASGYVRIYDSVVRSYIKLDGTPGNDDETHFRILKKEEM